MMGKVFAGQVSAPFNRTIIELKLYSESGTPCRFKPFNRTIIELKSVLAGLAARFICTAFNRTIIELKFF